ncbi:MAG: ATP-binding protein, partial [Phycisphaerales bacterium]
MTYVFKPAQKSQRLLRMVLSGATNSGKTYSALRIATGISEAIGKPIAFIDTENYSSSLYADRFKFDQVNLTSFSPSEYCKAIEAAEAAGYGVIIIDSATHAWSGKDGALDRVDRARTKSGDPKGFTAWREVTPLHNQFVETMLRCKCHLLVTLREKMEHVQEVVDGKTTVRRLGMAPIQRDGMEYEFDIGVKMDGAIMTVTKTRWSDLHNEMMEKPDEAFGRRLIGWLRDGAEVIDPAPRPVGVDDRLLPAPRLVQAVKQWAGQMPGTVDEINAEVRRIVHCLGAQIGIDLTARKAEPDECLRMIELLQQHQAAGRKPADLPAPKPAAKASATTTAPVAETPTRGESAPAASTPP